MKKKKLYSKKAQIKGAVDFWMEKIKADWLKKNDSFHNNKLMNLDEVNEYYIAKLAYEIAMKHPKKTRKIIRQALEKVPDEVFNNTWSWQKRKTCWTQAFDEVLVGVWGPLAPMVREVY